MEELRKELIKYIKTRGVKLMWIAEQIDINYSTLSKFKGGARDLPERWVEVLTEFLRK